MDEKLELFKNTPIPRAIAALAIPTVLTQIITAIYNLADVFWVGRTGDPDQVAALTLAFPLFMGLTLIGNLFGIGGNSFIARSLGAEKWEQARKASTFSFYGALAVTVVFGAAVYLNMDPLLRLIGASDATIGYTRQYLVWVLLAGGLQTEASLMLGHLLRAIGEAKKASAGLMLGGLLNIALDPLLIFGLKMGAPGAGVATCLSNTAALIYLLVQWRRLHTDIVDLRPAHFSLQGHIVKSVLLVGFPSALIILLASTGNMVMTRCSSAYGDVAIAAFGVTQKANLLVAYIANGLAQGVMPLISYNYVAGAGERVRRVIRLSTLLLLCFAVLTVALLELLPRQYMLAFISDEETVALGTRFLRILCLPIPCQCVIIIMNSIFQAIGKWKYSLALNVARQGVLNIPMLLIMDRLFGLSGLVRAQPIAELFSLLFALGLFLREVRCGNIYSDEPKEV